MGKQIAYRLPDHVSYLWEPNESGHQFSHGPKEHTLYLSAVGRTDAANVSTRGAVSPTFNCKVEGVAEDR